jgi:hypothetical protein
VEVSNLYVTTLIFGFFSFIVFLSKFFFAYFYFFGLAFCCIFLIFLIWFFVTIHFLPSFLSLFYSYFLTHVFYLYHILTYLELKDLLLLLYLNTYIQHHIVYPNRNMGFTIKKIYEFSEQRATHLHFVVRVYIFLNI